MECPSCGGLVEPGSEHSNRCSAAPADERAGRSAASGELTLRFEEHTSKLIDFPGVSRNTIPQWRKELSERVREVQEKRAREDTLDVVLEKKTKDAETSNSTPQLELLPQTEVAPVNPLVAAALRRIERANESRTYVGRSSHSSHSTHATHSTHSANATAVAYASPVNLLGETQPQEEPTTSEDNISSGSKELQPVQSEKSHNLVVVPAATAQTEPSRPTSKPKPRRMIAGDLNDPALNYLDSVPTVVKVEPASLRRASVLARFISALIDLMVLGLLCAPFAVALELTNTNWQDPRIWIFSAGMFSIVGFLYFTISTALTGRTLGLRLLSLKIVDARTGLIPTGTQAAGRAIIYLASLLILGITSVSALLNLDGLTAHDRITRTAVVQS